MLMPGFLGGNDVQRSLNLADNRCVNLYATTDDKGEVTGFYSTPGLAPYATAASIFTGIYTASNGRCFAVSGTTFYEITTGGVLTSRGTVTAGTVSRMTDNGIELMLVNGTDGWLFTFATNALKKISVLSSDFTVTIASPAVFSTVAAHGLVAGDVIRLTTTTANNTVSGQLNDGVPSYLVTSNNAKSMIVSPDNMNAYYCTPDGLVYQFLRDAAGNLSPLSPPSYYSGLVQLRSLEMSPDGKFVYGCATINTYVAGLPIPESHLVIFSRSLTTGVLTFDSSINFGATDLTTSSKITPDGLAMYVYTSAPTTSTGKIYQYSRNTATGHLTALTPATLTDVYNTDTQIVIPADGISLYLLSRSTNQVSCYSRNVTTSLLTAIGLVSTGLSPVGIAITADKKFIYITNNLGESISIFSRNLTTGVLTISTTVTLYGVTPISTPTNIIISPDDLSVYVGSDSPVIFQFDRNATTGAITAMTDKPYSLSVPSAHSNSLVITANSKSVYLLSTGTPSVICMLTRQVNAIGVGLPTGLATLTDYYVIATGLTANTFQVSLTSGGAAVNTTGVQAGTHTYHTIGYGFPNGAKTVSYIDGRFVACQPNTQNFYVSDVLKGGYWDALNVQTADSNPDYVVGQIVSHNELIIFCEQSGETFYDSGTYPSPFVRNVSGIFEVGCIAPYSIAKIDNSVMWLGKSNTGQGVVYRLNGYTPVRLSSYAIEYAMQTMSTISDAQAFTYQQEGHHFYVITFPSGGRTFAFDINTNLWHERAGWNGSALTRWEGQEYTYFDGKHLVCDNAAGNIYSMDLGTFTDGGVARKWIRSWRAPPSEMKRTIHHKLTLEAEVGVPSIATLTALGSISTGTTPMGLVISSDGNYVYAVNDTSNTISQYSRSSGLLTSLGPVATGRQPWGIVLSPDGLNAYVTNYTDNNISQYSRSGGLLTVIGVGVAAGTTPRGIVISADGKHVYVANQVGNTISMYSRTGGLLTGIGTIATGSSPQYLAISPDGMNVYVANYNDNTISQYSRNSISGLLTAIGSPVATGTNPVGIMISPDGNNVYTANSNANTISQYSRAGGLLTQIGSGIATGANPYFLHISTDGLIVCCANYGASTISQYSRTGGLLTPIGSDIATGANPWNIAMSPDSLNIYTTNYTGNTISEYSRTFTVPTVSLKYSNDGGHTWSADNWRDLSMGTLGQYSKRIYWYRLGMTTGQTRLYELSSVSPTKVALLNTYLE